MGKDLMWVCIINMNCWLVGGGSFIYFFGSEGEGYRTVGRSG